MTEIIRRLAPEWPADGHPATGQRSVLAEEFASLLATLKGASLTGGAEAPAEHALAPAVFTANPYSGNPNWIPHGLKGGDNPGSNPAQSPGMQPQVITVTAVHGGASRYPQGIVTVTAVHTGLEPRGDLPGYGSISEWLAEAQAGGPGLNSGVYHYTPDTVGGLAAANFGEKFGSTPNANVRATRDDLGLSDSDTLILDVGGEGQKLDKGTGMASGNEYAVNLNWQPTISPGHFTVSNGPCNAPVDVNSNGNVAIPNLVRPASDWGSNPSYPFADKSVDAVMMEGAPLTEKNVQEMTRVVSDKGWIMLNIDPSFKPKVDEIVKARGGKLFEQDNPNGFKTYYIGPHNYDGPSPLHWPPQREYGVSPPVDDGDFAQFVGTVKHDEL